MEGEAVDDGAKAVREESIILEPAGGGQLKGKLALITGAASGIGRAICRAFAEEGATIVCADINADGLNETMELLVSGSQHRSFVADVSKTDDISELFKKIDDEYKKAINVLVNSAGIYIRSKLLDLTEEVFERTIATNFKGVFLTTKEAAKRWIASGEKGQIINIASMASKVVMPEFSHYSASKAAVLQLTRSTACELADYGIKCNAVMPGLVDTPLLNPLADIVQAQTAMIPMKRLGKPEDISGICVFLVSDKSSYITGACIEVSGGYGM